MYKGLIVGIIVAVLFVLVVLLAYNNQRLTQENADLIEQLTELEKPVVFSDIPPPPEPPVEPKLQISKEHYSL